MESVAEKILYDVGARLEHLIKGKSPQLLNVCDYESEIEQNFVEVVNHLLESFEEVRRFIIPLSQGKLEEFAPKKGNYLASPFKELHSRLKHLTWQSKQVATGDFSQRVEFMGEFSDAFNSMVEKLAQREQQLKEANEALEHKVKEQADTVKKLDQSNQQLQEFTYIASHDLREPLRKISGLGRMLIDSLGGKLQGEDRENLDFMMDGAKRMQELIDALLTYSRVTTKEHKSEIVDLNETVKGLCSFELSIKIEETGTNIMVPEPLHHVRCDLTLVRQLTQNLIANGIKYQKQGNKPEITITSALQDKGMVRINVKDNGIGIDKENCDKVFVMFKRLHTRQEYEGTGIGLAVCKRIAERLGGEIGVSSVYGQGSTFWFTLPAAEM